MLARLNEETQVHHAEADSDVDRYLFRSQVTAASYRTFLTRVYGFLAPLEPSLAMTPELDALVDIKGRAKTALVIHDLLALGLSMDDINQLPVGRTAPVFRHAAEALGWLYVIERPLLSSAVIRGHLATYLRAEMAYGSAYLACYAGHVGTMWRELGEVMNRVSKVSPNADRMIVGAHEGFRALARWYKQDGAIALRKTG